jgi:hypothetical protein
MRLLPGVWPDLASALEVFDRVYMVPLVTEELYRAMREP